MILSSSLKQRPKQKDDAIAYKLFLSLFSSMFDNKYPYILNATFKWLDVAFYSCLDLLWQADGCTRIKVA